MSGAKDSTPDCHWRHIRGSRKRASRTSSSQKAEEPEGDAAAGTGRQAVEGEEGFRSVADLGGILVAAAEAR